MNTKQIVVDAEIDQKGQAHMFVISQCCINKASGKKGQEPIEVKASYDAACNWIRERGHTINKPHWRSSSLDLATIQLWYKIQAFPFNDYVSTL